MTQDNKRKIRGLINLQPFRNFFKTSVAGGVVLLFCVIVSLIIYNSPWGFGLNEFFGIELGTTAFGLELKYPISLWVNDGLMAIFFLLVGLEIKRELVEGELSSPRKAALPVVAAIGGVAVPALIYITFNKGLPTAGGWGIPLATDIAFAFAVINMLGNRVPASLKIFLAALAIVDDLMAILIIAIFYTSELHLSYLAYAGIIYVGLIIMNLRGVKSIAAYLIPGAFIWYFVHHSGIHATIAGVMVAFTLPTTQDEVESPLEKLEHALSKPVNFLIMPIFAIANTDIFFEPGIFSTVVTPLGLGIILGLFLGKPIGIFLATFLAVKLGAKLPIKADWVHILGVGMLAGIGFTMSIFIALLSFEGNQLFLTEAKFFVLTASVLSGLAGSALLILHNKAVIGD